MAASWVANKCGGVRWRTLRDGTIEVEGIGVPTIDPAGAQFRNMAQTWANWKAIMAPAAREHDVPLPWVLAIATVETGYLAGDPAKQASVSSSAGAVGVMQLMPLTAKMLGMTAAERTDPEKNIWGGVKLMRLLADGATGPELPNIASAYNAGSGSTGLGVRCATGRNEWNLMSDANYPRQAVQLQNTARLYLDLQTSRVSAAMVTGVGLAIAGIAVAVYMVGYRS
jgi:soluble lytic murein transglycosylase-like protein